MIIYGANPVLEALKAHAPRIEYIAISRGEGRRAHKIVESARAAGVTVRFVPDDQLERLAGGAVHNGVVAEVRPVEAVDFEDIIVESATRFVLLLDGIQDPQNFGAILRVADVFGVDLVVLPEHDSVGLTGTVIKASAGASEWVRTTEVTNLSRAIEELKKNDYWVYAAEADGEPIDEVDFSGRVALVVGNEGKGIRQHVLQHCDRKIAIPMRGHVDSLNVAAATAVIAYEIDRQRRAAEEEEEEE